MYTPSARAFPDTAEHEGGLSEGARRGRAREAHAAGAARLGAV